MFTSFWIIILPSLLYCCGPTPVFGQYEDDQPMEDHQNEHNQLEPQQPQEPQDVPRQSATSESKPTSGNNPSLQDAHHRQHQYPPAQSSSSSQQHQQQQLVFKPINDYIQGKSTILEQQFQPAVDSINDLFVKVTDQPDQTADIHSKGEKHYPRKPYGFGYDIDDGYGNKQWRHEKSSGPNQVTGSYGYQDKNGVMREVQYIADKYGFRAIIKTTEPGTASSDPAYVKMNANPLPVEYYPAKEYPSASASASGGEAAAAAASAVNRKAKEMVQQYPGEMALLNGRPNRPQPEKQLQHHQQQPPPPPTAAAEAFLDNDVGNFLSLFTPSNLNTNHNHLQQRQPQQPLYHANRNPHGPRLMMRSASSSSASSSSPSLVSSLPPLSFESNDPNQNDDYHLASTNDDPNIMDYQANKANPY